MTAFDSFRTRGRRDPGRSLAIALVLLVAATLGGVFAAGCGVTEDGAGASASPGATSPAPADQTPSAGETASQSPAAQTTVRAYFLRGEKLGVAQRQVPGTDAVARAAMTALLGGVDAGERAAGLSSAVPAGTRLLDIAIADGTATVDLSAEFASGGGSLSMAARVAQVVYTLTQYPTIEAVDFRVDGEPLTELGGEGLIMEPGQTRGDWRDYEPDIFVEGPGVGAVLTSPFVLEGTALVFEGAFIAELEDGAGEQLVFVPVQASAGGPDRGDFRETVEFATQAAGGTLIVYAQSAEDGSRQDEVRIPVTFAP